MKFNKLEETRKNNKFNEARWATEEEALILYNLVKDNDIDLVVECGTANGYSACYMASAEVTVITIDIKDRPKIWEEYPEYECLSIVPVKGTFHKRVKDLTDIFYFGLNILFFIDGNHSKSGVTKDFDAIVDDISEGDQLVFHDSHTEEGVVNFMERIKNRFPKWEVQEYSTKRGITVFKVIDF